MRSRKILLAGLCAVLGACGLCLLVPRTLAQSRIALVGSGSNLPINLYTAWTDEFNKKNNAVSVRYLSMSTVEGIRQITEGSGDFAAREIPLIDEQMHGPKVTLGQIPTVLVAIVPIYKLPGNPVVRFSGEVLAEIFLGNIKTWNDSRITKLNPGVTLPDGPIKVVHRTGGKGSNYIFTDFLSKTSAEWRSKVGKSPSPKWPVGEEANRGEEMVEKVSTNSGAIGYVELNFARRTDIGYGDVKNAAGNFVRATPESIVLACNAVTKSIPADFRASLANAPGKDSYPLSSFTWIYAPVSGLTVERARALKQFLNWGLEDGQNIARSLGYATLPAELAGRARKMVNSIQ